jgi:pimeloyl-ACP methyl ester carboxylesterase
VLPERETILVPCSRTAQEPPRAWLYLLILLLLSSRAFAAAPARVDLNTFDALKRSVTLANGQSLAYVPLGDAAGRPVVLIHGYTDNARDWVPLVPYLPRGWRLILVDLRGHGRSGKPECCYTRLDFAYDVKLLLDALHIERADIVGHSMGSIVAQTFAEYWPERTRRVVLIASSGGARAGAPPRKPAYDYAAEIRKLHEPIDPDSPFMIQWWSSPTPVDADFLRRQRQDAAAIPLRVWLAILDQGLIDSDLQRTLPKLTAPTLLIWGSKDPIMAQEVRQTLRAALPHAQLKIFAGLGHNPFWEDPQGCARVINAFLTAAPQGAPAAP